MLLPLSPIWIPSNLAHALTDLTRLSPKWAQVLTFLSGITLTGLSLYWATSSLYFCSDTLFFCSPICVDALLTLFCFQYTNLRLLTASIPHSMVSYLAWTILVVLGLNSSGRKGKGSRRRTVCLFILLR